MQWHQGSIPEAISQAKERQAIFMVFIAGSDEQSQDMERSLETVFASKNVSNNCIALKLEANGDPSKQFSQIYPVVIIPSTYFIGLNGVPLEVVGGQLDGDTLMNKINGVFEMHEKEKSSRTVPDSAAVRDAPTGSSMATPDQFEIVGDVAEAQLSVDDKVERAKQLVAQRRELKALEEEEKEKQMEIERRKMGREVQKQRTRQQEQETKQVADEIARERAEEKAAREKVREQIARDRAERAAKYSADKVEKLEKTQEFQRAKLQAEQDKTAADAAIRSKFARIQFRLPDGSSATVEFDSDAPLETIFNYVKETIKPAFGSFTLSLSFPRREFTRSDFSQSLRDLQLTPSAAILILPCSSAVSSYDSAGLVNFLWLFLSPVLTLWRMLQTFFFGSGRQPPPPPSNGGGHRATSPSSASNSNKQRGGSGGPRSFSRQDGNVHRLADGSSEDNEDNNTWNGNSTQQM